MGNRMRIITVAADCAGKIEQNSHLHGRERCRAQHPKNCQNIQGGTWKHRKHKSIVNINCRSAT